MQIISPWNHGSSKAEKQIQTIGNMISKHLSVKRSSWPLYATMSAYFMNIFASNTLQGLSPFELVFTGKPSQLTSFEMPKLQTIEPKYREFFKLLMDKAKMYRDMDVEWCTVQALELQEKIKCFQTLKHLWKMILYTYWHCMHLLNNLMPRNLGKIMWVH